MTDWHITEHSSNVALRLGQLRAVAVGAQARRVQKPHQGRERIPDIYLLVMALRNGLRAAEMAKKNLSSPQARAEIQKAIGVFLSQVILNPKGDQRALVDARDVLEHFDEYLCGTGKLQRDAAKRNQGMSKEDLAQSYRIDFEPPADRSRLRVGLRPAEPLLIIDLVETAPEAADQLSAAVGAAVAQDQAGSADEQRSSDSGGPSGATGVRK